MHLFWLASLKGSSRSALSIPYRTERHLGEQISLSSRETSKREHSSRGRPSRGGIYTVVPKEGKLES